MSVAARLQGPYLDRSSQGWRPRLASDRVKSAWMDPRIPYLICLLGAAALYILLRPGQRAIKPVAAILGLGALAWLLVETQRFWWWTELTKVNWIAPIPF